MVVSTNCMNECESWFCSAIILRLTACTAEMRDKQMIRSSALLPHHHAVTHHSVTQSLRLAGDHAMSEWCMHERGQVARVGGHY